MRSPVWFLIPVEVGARLTVDSVEEVDVIERVTAETGIHAQVRARSAAGSALSELMPVWGSRPSAARITASDTKASRESIRSTGMPACTAAEANS